MPDLTPNELFTELVSTTLKNHSSSIVDNMSQHNALFRYMKKGKNTRTEDGGLSIVQALDYAQNGTFQRYSGYDTLNVSASETLTSAEFPWRQISISVVASGEEIRKNSGKSRIIALVESRIKNARRTFENNFSADLYGNGTLPNQINGLRALVSDTGTNTVGGINSTDWDFWQNKVQSAAAPIQGGSAITVSKDTIQSLMLPLWLRLNRGADKPNLILADHRMYTHYEESLTDLKRYTSSDEGKGGFTSLKYKSADVIFDNEDIPTDHMYFLNTEYMHLVVHTDANMTPLEKMRPYNQDASVNTMIWMGNMTISNRQLQGVLTT